VPESSVWRVLKGPNNDWPLAVCDYQSVDPKGDVLPNDVLHEDCVGENWLLQKSRGHSWYYLSEQKVEDLIVFRNVDSKNERSSRFQVRYNSWPQTDRKHRSLPCGLRFRSLE